MQTGEKILVTGATGFIGTRLVEALTAAGHAVRALSRRSDPEPPPGFDRQGGGPLRHPQVELVRGDIADADSLRRAVDGCARVFHLAGYAKNWAPNPQTYFDVNVQGLKNVLDAARAAGVQKVVWTSSALSLGPTPPGMVADEDMPRASDRYLTMYEHSKVLAEQEALEYVRQGLAVVTVNPTRVFGPGHLTEGNSVSLLIDQYDRGMVPFLLNRGVNVGNYVLVDDVVQGLVLAMARGRPGQRYLLGGENVSLREFFRTIDAVSGKRHRQIPLWVATPLAFAYLLRKRAEWLGVWPQITPDWVRTFATNWPCRSDKAVRELGYQPTPLVEGIRRTYQWLERVRSQTR